MLPGHCFWRGTPELSVEERGNATAQNATGHTVCTPGACSLMGVGTVCTGYCHSAEPVAQLEEQVEKNEGGELGRGPHSESGRPQPPPEEGLKCQMKE